MVATPSAITAPQRVVASHFFKVVLANVNSLAANAQTLAASRRLREALQSCSQWHLAKHSRVARNGTSDIACRATITGQAIHIENSTIQMHHVEGYADLEWPIDAHAIAGIFHARASVTPKRVLRSLRTQKVLATVRQTERATPRRARSCAPIKMRNISIKTRARRGLPNMHTTAKKLAAHVIWPRPKTRPGIFLQS